MLYFLAGIHFLAGATLDQAFPSAITSVVDGRVLGRSAADAEAGFQLDMCAPSRLCFMASL